MENSPILRKIGVDNFLLTAIMLLFSLFGAVFGMSEETIAFCLVLVPMAISMGYDSITGVCMVFIAAGLGFAGAILNPFTIGIAQGLAGIPLFSGIEYRIVCWCIINAVGFTWILRYAAKVKKNLNCLQSMRMINIGEICIVPIPWKSYTEPRKPHGSVSSY